jgi:hypothetical protein
MWHQQLFHVAPCYWQENEMEKLRNESCRCPAPCTASSLAFLFFSSSRALSVRACVRVCVWQRVCVCMHSCTRAFCVSSFYLPSSSFFCFFFNHNGIELIKNICALWRFKQICAAKFFSTEGVKLHFQFSSYHERCKQVIYTIDCNQDINNYIW